MAASSGGGPFARIAVMESEATYTCGSCGEEIVIPVDYSAGTSQEFTVDCPVCCRANMIHVEIEEDGGCRVWAETE